MAVVRLIFRPCVGNHPSVTFGDSSPQGAPISHLMFAVAPLEGWFLAANLTPMGWFPVQNLKINRARPVNGPMASIGPYK